MGESAYFLCNDLEAEEHWETALSLYKEIGDKSGEATCIKATGDIVLSKLWMEGCEDARTRYQEALSVFIEEKDKQGEISCLNALGRISCLLKNYQDSSEYYQKVLALCERIGNKQGQASGILGLGEVALALDNYIDAERYYREALEIYKKVGNQFGEAKCIKGIGDVKFWLDHEQEAIEFYQKSRKIYHDTGVKINEALTFKSLGQAAFWLGNYQEAKKLDEILNNKSGVEACSKEILSIKSRQDGSIVINKEDKYVAKRGHLTRKLSFTNEEGERKFCYLMLKPEKQELYFQHLKNDPYNNNWEEYGEILAICDGHDPDEIIIKIMTEKYGFVRMGLLISSE